MSAYVELKLQYKVVFSNKGFIFKKKKETEDILEDTNVFKCTLHKNKV